MKNSPRSVIFALICSACAIVAAVVYGHTIRARSLTGYQAPNQQTYFDQTQNSAAVQTAFSSTTTAYSNRDTDNDGLADWEEVLYGTDPHKADTDDDGMSDTDEIKKGRDPLEKGAGTGAHAITSTQSAYKKPAAPLTETEKLSRNFFAQYMTLRQSGLQKDTDSRDAAMRQALEQSLTDATPKQYTRSDIRVITVTDPLDLRAYGNAMGSAIKDNQVPSRNETVILRESIDKQNAAILKELDPILASYIKMRQALLKVPVPEPMVDTHLKFINAISSLIFASQSFQKLYSDPVVALQGIKQFEKGAQDSFDAMSDIHHMLITNNFTFEATEGGIFFIKK